MILSAIDRCGRWARVTAVLVLSLLSLAVHAKATHSVDLAWDPDTTTPQLAGYKLYFGNTSGSYSQTLNVGSSTTVVIPNLQGATTYYFVVTEYDTTGLESQPSNEVSFVTTPDATPVVSLTSPGKAINGPADITLTAAATVNNASIVGVSFFANGSQIGSVSSAPYTMVWKSVQPGNYNVSAVALDSNGMTGVSAAASFQVVTFGVTGLSRVEGGTYRLTITGVPGSSYDVYVSEDLNNWRLSGTVTNTNGTLSYIDPTANQVRRRFYKLAVRTTGLNVVPLKTDVLARK